MTTKACHPERALSFAERGAQVQSKDPCNLDVPGSRLGCFRIAVRFYDEQGAEVLHETSREAAMECTPRRKPWVEKKR